MQRTSSPRESRQAALPVAPCRSSCTGRSLRYPAVREPPGQPDRALSPGQGSRPSVRAAPPVEVARFHRPRRRSRTVAPAHPRSGAPQAFAEGSFVPLPSPPLSNEWLRGIAPSFPSQRAKRFCCGIGGATGPVPAEPDGMQRPLEFLLSQRRGQHVVTAEVQYFGPEAFVGKPRQDEKPGRIGHPLNRFQHHPPVPVRQGGGAKHGRHFVAGLTAQSADCLAVTYHFNQAPPFPGKQHP